MKQLIYTAIVFTSIAIVAACTPSTTQRLNLPPLQTVEAVDLERYMGTWYEIASFPQRFQEGCTGTTATYNLLESGKVKVVNRCFENSLNGEERVATGRARAIDESNAKLEVSFFGPFWGDYWIIELGDSYDYAVVASPGRDYLWILNRAPHMPSGPLDSLLLKLNDEHLLDTGRLQFTQQPAAAVAAPE